MVDIVKRGRLSGADDADAADAFPDRFEERWFGPHLAIDRAHVVMLAEEGILADGDAGRILGALDRIEAAGFDALPERVDLHVAIEEAVIDDVGEGVGGRMHTGRSRNDKMSTAFRLIARDEVLGLAEAVLGMEEVLLDRAEGTADWLMSGYTHMQNAQPTTLGHYLLAHEAAFARDLDRLLDAYDRVNLNPLGSAAFGGTGWDIDRDRTTELLGFDAPLRNSMDGVAARDFAPESIAAAANAATNLSRLCQDLETWSSNEFGLVELADRHAGASSIMPQKKNPTSVELVRARAGTPIGTAAGVLATLKGVPMSHNMDLTTEPAMHLGEAFEAARDGFVGAREVVADASFDRAAMEAGAGRGFSTATELADAIVRETGTAFRTAHHVVGRIARDYDRADVTAAVVDEVAREVTGDPLGLDDDLVERALDPRRNVELRDSYGGPGEVDAALADARDRWEERRRTLESTVESLRDAERRLDRAVEELVPDGPDGGGG